MPLPYFFNTDWKQLIGDICSVTILGQHMVIINSAKVANDMLKAKGSIYSDRPSQLPFDLTLTKTYASFY